ncbi:MAG: putative sugar nucleotidyl transferase [Bacteroidota bacterium]
MKILLHDNGLHLRFAPLTLTRPVGDLRIGIFTNSERWKHLVQNAEIFYATEAYLQKQFQGCDQPDIVVNAAIIPSSALAKQILELSSDEKLMKGSHWVAYKGDGSNLVESSEEILILENRWELYQKNGLALSNDFEIITKGRKSQGLSITNTLIGDASQLFIEEGATVEASILNVKSGPIYIGKNAEIMEGSVVRGPLAMCESSGLKLATKIYGPTTLGPHCKVGGEVNNVIFQAYSNKGHDGFLGNALIGEWCNLGADTNCSNLKNNYGMVSTYSYESQKEEKTNAQFMGLTMGDHSKCGINTMFNTATVVGVSSNIYGAGFPDKFIKSFQWGGADEMVDFRFNKAIEVANNMMERRGLQLTDGEMSILKHIAEQKIL